MNTLIMNNSMVMAIEALVSDDLEAILTQIIDGRCSVVSLSKGTLIEIDFETEAGAARFGFCSGENFLTEALVLGTGQGRQCWAPFRAWCEHLLAEGSATGQHPLPLGVPDANAWHCIIVYDACWQLENEELGGFVKLQSQLAAAYVRRLDQGPARG